MWLKSTPAVLAAVGAALIAWWLIVPPHRWAGRGPATNQTPLLGAESPPMTGSMPASVPVVKLPGILLAGEGTPAEGLGGSWPNFRGPNHDAVSAEAVGLARSWPPGGPKVLWSLDVGAGYAGPAVARGRVYLLDHDERRKADVLRCLSLADGKEIWQRWYSNPLRRQHGVSRTIPAVTDKYVVTLGPGGHVLCVDADTGRDRWSIDLVAEYGTTVPEWYAGQCPLIDDGRAIIAPAGSALMIAVDCGTGRVVWETPNPRGWKMTHSSIIPVTFNARKMYVYCATGGVAGVAADTGKTLWTQTAWQMRGQDLAPSPVPIGEGRIFLAGGYEAGSMMLQLTEAGGEITSEVLFELPEHVFGSAQQTPVFYAGHIYGVSPAGKLVCLDADGSPLWDSGEAQSFDKGYGPYMVADGMLLVMGRNGMLVLAEAKPTGYRQLAKAQVVGKESWGPMALAGGRLIVRDIQKLVCLDVRGE